MIIPAAKQFEKPEAGPHFAVLIDVVDLGIITSTFNGQTKQYPALRFIWSLATVGKDGKPLQVWSKKINASSWHEKGNLYQTVKQILGVPPQPTLDPESLIGQVRQVFVSREKSPDGLKDYANIIGIVPAPAGFNLPIPADYVRVKYRPQQTAGPNGQPVQTYQAPPPQQQPQQTPPFAPQPVPGQGATIKF
jgi:hypothetical protein